MQQQNLDRLHYLQSLRREALKAANEHEESELRQALETNQPPPLLRNELISSPLPGNELTSGPLVGNELTSRPLPANFPFPLPTREGYSLSSVGPSRTPWPEPSMFTNPQASTWTVPTNFGPPSSIPTTTSAPTDYGSSSWWDTLKPAALAAGALVGANYLLSKWDPKPSPTAPITLTGLISPFVHTDRDKAIGAIQHPPPFAPFLSPVALSPSPFSSTSSSLMTPQISSTLPRSSQVPTGVGLSPSSRFSSLVGLIPISYYVPRREPVLMFKPARSVSVAHHREHSGHKHHH